jgi:hypothetical protein
VCASVRGYGGRYLTPHAHNVEHHSAVGCMRTSGCCSFVSCKIGMVQLQWLGDTDAAIGMK